MALKLIRFNSESGLERIQGTNPKFQYKYGWTLASVHQYNLAFEQALDWYDFLVYGAMLNFIRNFSRDEVEMVFDTLLDSNLGNRRRLPLRVRQELDHKLNKSQSNPT